MFEFACLDGLLLLRSYRMATDNKLTTQESTMAAVLTARQPVTYGPRIHPTSRPTVLTIRNKAGNVLKIILTT